MFEQFKKGIFYTSIGKYAVVVIQFIVQIFLGRLLISEELGIVATVNIFLVFFQLLADFGLGPAIIQNKTLKRTEIHSIFTFSIYLALLLSVIFLFLGRPLAAFYNNDAFVSISVILAICVFFYGALVVPQSLLLREQDFKTVNLVTIIGSLIFGVVSVVLAFLGFSYYSLIIGNTARAATIFIIFYFKTQSAFTVKFEWAPLKKIYAFSKNQFLFNFINYFSRNLDNLLIGRVISQSALGYYDRAYQISLYPNQILTSLVTSVIHPIMSEYEKETERIKAVYLKLANILAIVGMPLSVLIFFAANDIVLVFGQNWAPSAPTLQILGLSVWIQMLLSSTGGVFQSGNRTDLLLLSGILSTTLNVAGIITGILFGRIEYVAAFLVFAFFCNFIQANYLLMVKLFQSSMLEYGAVLVKPVLMAIMQVIVYLLLPPLNYFWLVNLLIKGSLFLIVWLVGLLITGEFKRLKAELISAKSLEKMP
ncbi:lipopolysaccharide biosynthesis protein [Marinilactibacillus kalidii]|uniref:lipopolysaccharide biosynthesis protein n=1 Tax=Marinilactibacillus kalidii TaxID=2820274 RepID=UPI001ABE4734|nr:lipopolysaccharide biosynthesis protein [Marinilactibacillus kalidii]